MSAFAVALIVTAPLRDVWKDAGLFWKLWCVANCPVARFVEETEPVSPKRIKTRPRYPGVSYMPTR